MKFVETAEQKDASGFQTALESAMADKIANALQNRKAEVASTLLANKNEQA